MFARSLVSAKQMATGAVTSQGRAFGSMQSKSNEARVTVSFPTADAPVPVYHGLGHKPTGATAVAVNPGGVVYTDMPLVADSRTIVLYCNTASTIAEVIVR